MLLMMYFIRLGIMFDYWPDKQIDCKDYAIENTIKAQSIHAQHVTWVIDDKHIIVKFEKDGYLYIADNDKLYRVKLNK